jgi:predicted MFS family arabinose efflux permease
VSFAVGAVLLADFTWYERRITRAGREPSPASCPFFLVLAVHLQNGVGLRPLRSGILFIAIGAGYVVTATASGAVAERLGHQTVALGAAAMIAGLLLLDFGVHRISGGTGTGSALWAVPGLVVDGAGMGLIIAPMTSLVLARVAPKHVGSASGVLSMMTQLGGALGVAVVGINFCGSIAHRHASAARTLGHGFTSSSYLLVAIAATVLVWIQLLPRQVASDR